jgi:hypothetical protein
MLLPVSRWSLVVTLFALVQAPPAEAITIENHFDDPTTFLTLVKDSVGLFTTTHTLVDIPGTPWVNSSVIVETPGPAGGADSLSVTWTSQHIQGPHPDDVDPNRALTLTLTFTATAAGDFNIHFGGLPRTLIEIPHPVANGPPHFDRFNLSLQNATVESTLLGGLDITAYTIGYFALHCEVQLGPDFACFPPAPRFEDLLLVTTDGGFEQVPAPATLLLYLSGCLAALLARHRGILSWRSAAGRLMLAEMSLASRSGRWRPSSKRSAR